MFCVKTNLFGASCGVGRDPSLRVLRVSNAWMLRSDVKQICVQGQERLEEPKESGQAPDRPKS